MLRPQGRQVLVGVSTELQNNKKPKNNNNKKPLELEKSEPG
jgi:hypothetical protein